MNCNYIFFRFVLDTCKRLKEKKSYLVWNAVACLGVSAVCDLVKEVISLNMLFLHNLQFTNLIGCEETNFLGNFLASSFFHGRYL
jgi:PHAX RNA-binding domain